VLEPNGGITERVLDLRQLLPHEPRPRRIVIDDPDRGIEALVEGRVALHGGDHRRPARGSAFAPARAPC